MLKRELQRGAKDALPHSISLLARLWERGTQLIKVGVYALVFRYAPLPTSPVDGGGAATPSPPAGRVGVGAVFKSLRKDTYNGSAQYLCGRGDFSQCVRIL